MTNIPSIVFQMTLEEKAALCTGAGARQRVHLSKSGCTPRPGREDTKDMMNSLMEMPLRDILLFQKKLIGQPANELLDGLLQQVGNSY